MRGERRAAQAGGAITVARERQSDLFDPLEGMRRRNEGMAAVSLSAEARAKQWRDDFFEVVRRWGQVYRIITSEDVTAEIGPPPNGVHHNAVGATMRAAAMAAGLVVIELRKGKMPGKHAGRLAAWGLPSLKAAADELSLRSLLARARPIMAKEARQCRIDGDEHAAEAAAKWCDDADAVMSGGKS